MSEHEAGELIAAVALALLVALLARVGRKDAVATSDVTVTPRGEPARTCAAGTPIPKTLASAVPAASKKEVRRSWLAGIVVGKDHRASTSKTVAFLWTLAVAWGLLSLFVASVLGAEAGWDAQLGRDLQEEYLLLLGGPYAAAVVAKYAAVRDPATTSGAARGEVGGASASQLVSDDAGDTDLGDFQYLLFNLIALAFFVVEFLGDPEQGFPDLPELLTGLALTSAGGYTLKKLVGESRPALTSVVPAAAAAGESVTVYGTNLRLPASAAPAGSVLDPSVSVGGKVATITAHAQVLGADRLTVTVPPGAAKGAGSITVVRADGVAAVGPAGSEGIAFTVA